MRLARLAALKPIEARALGSGHALSLCLVAAGCVAGQVAILVRRPLVFQLPDSPSYITLATRLIHQPDLGNLFDAYRTPGYPAFLALIGLAQGSVADTWVVYVQACLVVVTAFELYVLTFGLTGSRAAGAVAGILFGSNVRLLDWERLIMTESLAIFLVTTIALAFWLWMKHRAALWVAVFGVASAFAVLTRPSLLYVPICLLAVVLVGDRRRWLSVVLLAVAVYLPVLGYSAVNDRLNPHAGLSAVSNINLLGKILEYDMQGEGDAARFPTLWQGISSLPRGDRDPYDILTANPAAMGTNYADASAFSQDIIERHPFEYLAKSTGDFFGQWLIAPFAYTPPGPDAWLAQALAAFALVTYAAYPALPLAIIGLVVLWRRMDRLVARATAALIVVVVGSLGISALFSYVDFARLRTPVDAIALAAVVAVAAHSFEFLAPHSVRRALSADKGSNRRRDPE
jgi:hypothetical protein